MRKHLLFIAAIVVFATSCKVVGTLHSLSNNENDFLFKKELLGKWGDTKDRSGSFTIDTVAGTKGKLYRAELKDSISTNWFLLRLIKVENWHFLDCQFDMSNLFPSKENDNSDMLIAKHFFYKVTFTDPGKIELSFPDPDQLLKLIDEKKILLHYTTLKKDYYLILNESKELQKGLAESKKYPLLYKDKIGLVRIK